MGDGHGFEAVANPKCVVEGEEEIAEAAADVEKTPGLTEAFEESDFVAVIAAEVRKLGALRMGPVAFAVVGLEFGGSELGFRTNEAAGAAN